MLKEYHELVDHLSQEEKVALRGEWEKKMENVLDDEAVALSPAARLKRAEKYMLDAVRNLFFLFSMSKLRGYSPQCMVAMQLDPHTHVAAVCISTSSDPYARQMSSVVTSSSVMLDLMKGGEFDVKKVVTMISDIVR